MTLPQMIRDRHEKWKSRTCMMIKRDGRYVDVTWSEFYGKVEQVASAMIAMGLHPGDRAAILSHTRWEWAISDSGSLTAGLPTVPIYPTLTAREVRKLLERSGARLVFVSDAEQVEKMLAIVDDLPKIEKVVVFENEALEGVAHPKFISLDTFTNITVDEKHIAERLDSCKGSDCCTIIFTSGTTGEPKGAMLTHENILSNTEASLSLFSIDNNDSCLAHLPLAHIFERMAGYYTMLYAGAVIAYAEDLTTVAQNMTEVRPTVIITVPRIFEKIYAGIQAKALESPAPVRALTFWAINVATKVGTLRHEGKPVPGGLGFQYKLAETLVYKKVREKFGGRVRVMASGGAPLAKELAIFFNTIGLTVCEGYGLTETSPVIAANHPDRVVAGTVGQVIPGVEVKIAEDGEIVVRGPNIFLGYYMNEEATKASFNEEGWFMTGDIGEFDEKGYLRITDRKKDLLVTAGGKNIAPQKVENVLKMDKYIAEAMLYGDKKKFVSAVIVPDFEWLDRYAKHKKIHYAEKAELIENPSVRAMMERRIAKAQADAHLSPFETVKKFVLLDHEFSQDEGEVTPTLKIRRKNIIEHYMMKIEALYESE